MVSDGRGHLQISRIEAIPVTVPRSSTFRLQRGDSDRVSPFTVLRITTDEGVVGYGESVTRTTSLHRVLEDHLTERLLGCDPFNVVDMHRRFDEIETLVTERREHWNPIRAAVDMALYDIQGKWAGVPVYQLLGGKQRSRIETLKNIGIGDPAAAADEAVALVDRGFRVLKMRVGADHANDKARLEAVRGAVPDDVLIRVDANEAWDGKTAVQRIGDLAAYGLEGVEQPCKHFDLRGSSRVTAAVPVPIIADESVWTLGDAINILVAEAADVLHLYLGKCGGIYPVMRIVAAADGFAKAVTIGERIPLGISEAAHAHVAAAVGRLDYPCALTYDLNEDDLLVESLRHEAGHLIVPEGPGLGVQVDDEALDHYARQR